MMFKNQVKITRHQISKRRNKLYDMTITYRSIAIRY